MLVLKLLCEHSQRLQLLSLLDLLLGAILALPGDVLQLHVRLLGTHGGENLGALLSG